MNKINLKKFGNDFIANGAKKTETQIINGKPFVVFFPKVVKVIQVFSTVIAKLKKFLFCRLKYIVYLE